MMAGGETEEREQKKMAEGLEHRDISNATAKFFAVGFCGLTPTTANLQ